MYRKKLPAKNKALTHVEQKNNIEPVQSEITRLLKRLERACAARGKRAELARHLEVDMACISNWLSGKKEPGGETTLKLLHWVERQERQ